MLWQTAAHWLLETDPREVERQQQQWIKAFEKEQNAREAALQAEKDARKRTLARCRPPPHMPLAHLSLVT